MKMQRRCRSLAHAARASLLFALGAVACAASEVSPDAARLPGAAAGTRVAAATIAPAAELVRRVAGPGWTVYVVVPPGASAHVFEPTPRDVKRLAPAALVARIGAGYDDWMGRLAAACASRAVQLELAPAAGIGPAHSGVAHDHDHAHELSEETDPHFWLSPPRAIRALPAIAKALSQADPRGRAGYESRAASMAVDLLALDAELAERLAPLRGAAFVSAHPAFTHFAARYGLVQAASVEPVPGREPSPRALASLIHLARDHRLRVIFTEPQFPEAAARMIARDAGLGVTLVDPIGGVDGRRTYEELLRFNAAAFLAGLGTKS